jgi:predicted dienelactone hydrolase
MRSLSSLRALALLAICATGGSLSAHASDAVGVRMMSVMTPERGAPLALTLWYPAGSGGWPARVGANSVFVGVSALRDAAMADGVFPVVVVAHGGLRAAPHQSGWISARLAERGYIVAAVQPPVLTAGEAGRAVAEIGLRSADLSAALSAVEGDPSVRPHADMEKAAALGFFLGGASSLALAGARLDPERYRRLCDSASGGPDCAWFAAIPVFAPSWSLIRN